MNTAWPPLLAERAPQAPFAWRDGQAVSAEAFLQQAAVLAGRLDGEGGVLNLCRDRLNFAVGLAAAWLRGRPCLLPPNALPATLRALPPGATLALVDEALDTGALPHLDLRAEPASPTHRAGSGLPLDAHPAASLGEDPAVVLLTSGSTGTPQAHARHWPAVWLNARAQARRLEDILGPGGLEGLTLVCTVPPQHSYGFESSVMLAWQSGACLDAGRPFFPADVVASLERLPRPRALVTTPFHLRTLLESGMALPPVDLILCATAPLTPQLAAAAEARLGGALIEVYGCTEVGQVATRRTTAGPTWQTYPGLALQALDDAPGAGSAPASGRPRQAAVHGDYAPRPTELADWLEIDDAHHFRLLGRTGDLIKVAGKRSSLAHLDHQLNSIEGVRDGACWMPPERPDAIVRPVAFVVAPGMSARQVLAGLRERLEPVFVPRRIVFVDALPREATGKLTAAALRDLALRHLGEEGA